MKYIHNKKIYIQNTHIYHILKYKNIYRIWYNLIYKYKLDNAISLLWTSNYELRLINRNVKYLRRYLW